MKDTTVPLKNAGSKADTIGRAIFFSGTITDPDLQWLTTTAHEVVRHLQEERERRDLRVKEAAVELSRMDKYNRTRRLLVGNHFANSR